MHPTTENRAATAREHAGESRAHRHRRLLRLLGWAALAHVVAILLLSPGLYLSDENSPEALYRRGEQAMRDENYAQAMDFFAGVMNRQPKPPPIYTRAAEQHRLADRLARQAGDQAKQRSEQAAVPAPQSGATSRESTPSALTPATAPQPPGGVAPPARPKPFIPDELRR